MAKFASFWKLSNISLYVQSNYIYLSVDGHLGCFHILAIWIMLQWTWEKRSLWYPDFISFGYTPIIRNFFSCWGNCILFSLVAVAISFLSSAVVPIFPQPLQHDIFCTFDEGYEVASHCGLICISLTISDLEHLLIHLKFVYMSSLEKCVI